MHDIDASFSSFYKKKAKQFEFNSQKNLSNLAGNSHT